MIIALGDERPSLDEASNFVASSATLIGKVRLGSGTSIWFGAVLRGDNEWIRIGRNSNVQDGAILHADPGIPLTIGDGVTVGHRAMLHGCTVGDGCLIGIGSTVLNEACIGSESIVAAHSLVTEGKSFPDGVLLMGVPARVVRELDEEERARLALPADSYLRNSRRYRTQSQVVG